MPKRTFWINFAGTAKVDAENEEDAWKQVNQFLDCYVVARTTKEVGVTCDIHGAPLKKEKPMKS